ncbi:hypothetical protein [Synechococcus sp. N26]|uniref:hypothetical protein n=1 Tax=Synechococcus sp. N26 TaxID=2575513 RepID=UPI0010BD3860|nr:hypothetical protein [Synechococcus sp. N26]
MKRALNFALICSLGIVSSGCDLNEPEAAHIVGTLPGSLQSGRSCIDGFCFDNPTRNYYCPTGYVKVNDSVCKRISSQKNSWGFNEIASGIQESVENISKIKPPKPPETGDNSSAAYQWGKKEKDLGDAPEFKGQNYGYSLTPKNPSKEQRALYDYLGCKGTEFQKSYRSWDRQSEYKYISGSERCFRAMSAGDFSYIFHLVGDCSMLRRETGFRRYKDVYKCTM